MNTNLKSLNKDKCPRLIPRAKLFEASHTLMKQLAESCTSNDCSVCRRGIWEAQKEMQIQLDRLKKALGPEK